MKKLACLLKKIGNAVRHLPFREGFKCLPFLPCIREGKFTEGNLQEEKKVSLLHALQLAIYREKYYRINYVKTNSHWLFTGT